MNILPQQRRSFVAGLLGGYIIWDIIDHTLLQPQGWLGSYLVDWSIVGVVGITTWMVIDRVAQTQTHQEPAEHQTTSAVQTQTTQTFTELNQALEELQEMLGTALTEQGLEQQRIIRKALITVHQSQSFSDELHGLIAHHRISSPPPYEPFTGRI